MHNTHPPPNSESFFFHHKNEKNRAYEKQSWKKNPAYKKNSILMIFKRLGLQTEAAVLLNTVKKNKKTVKINHHKRKRVSYLMWTVDFIRKKSTKNVRGAINFNWICEIEWMILNLDSLEFLWISQMKIFRRVPDSHIWNGNM